MAGLEVLYTSAGSSINCPQDPVICFVHWEIIKSGFRCVGSGDTVSLQGCQVSRIGRDSQAIWAILMPHATLDISNAYFCPFNTQYFVWYRGENAHVHPTTELIPQKVEKPQIPLVPTLSSLTFGAFGWCKYVNNMPLFR